MLPELKTFISIVETDNVIKVMENLNLSKATVYEHLKYLEQFFRVNIALISRNNEQRAETYYTKGQNRFLI